MRHRDVFRRDYDLKHRRQVRDTFFDGAIYFDDKMFFSCFGEAAVNDGRSKPMPYNASINSLLTHTAKIRFTSQGNEDEVVFRGATEYDLCRLRHLTHIHDAVAFW